MKKQTIDDRQGGRVPREGDSEESGAAGRLDDRKATILRSVVAEYIDTAQPIGSSHVVRSAGLGVSPATVRNEMAILEDEGYLAQPHTSAGRVPTDKGYRFFVDGLPERAELSGAQKEEVRGFFARTHGELEQLLTETSRMLSTLTRYAAVVVGPNHESATIRSAQLVYLGSRSVLAVLVLSDGAVEKYSLEVDEDLTGPLVEAASQGFAARFVGHRRSRIDRAHESGTEGTSGDVTERLIAAAAAAMDFSIGDADQEPIFVRGASQMAEAFDAIETVRSVLSILEQQIMVVNLVRGVLDRDELTVAIGHEHGVVPLAECAIVVSPYRFNTDEVGVIGVLGPTRMHYAQAIATVAAVGQELEMRLVEG